MGKLKQLEKNVKLSEKLADYLAANPNVMKDFPSGSSFVAFSSSDEELNKFNEKLVTSLKKEGKKVIEAKEKSNKTKPWSFILAI